MPIGIGLLAAVLRLWAIDLAPFAYDEVDVLYRARDVVAGHWTVTGPLTSWGIPDPPVSVYLMIPPALLREPAIASAAWAALLNTVAVILTVIVTRRFFGSPTAFAAGVLFAVNPWAVYFGRRTWAEIQPVFTVVALWAVFEVVVCRRAAFALGFFVALALQVQTRILAGVFAPAALLSLLAFPFRWGVRWPLVGIGLGVLVSVPYVVYMALNWQEMAMRLAEGNRGIVLVPPPGSKRSVLDLVFWTLSGYGLLPATSRSAPWLNSLGWAVYGLVWVSVGLVVLGVLIVGWRAVRTRPGWEAGVLAVVWFVAPVMMLAAQSSTLYLHYMVVLFPVGFLLTAVPLGSAIGARSRVVSALGALLLVGVAIVQIYTTAALYNVLRAFPSAEQVSVELRQAAAGIPREASEQLATGERYGVETPIRFWLDLTTLVKSEARRVGLHEAWVVAGAVDPLLAERPAVLDFLLRPDLEPVFLLPDALVFPIGQQVLLLETPDVDTAERTERFGERRASIGFPSTNRTGLDNARITLIGAHDADYWVKRAPTDLLVPFAGDITLTGYRGERSLRSGDELTVVTYWRLGTHADPRPPSIGLRLLDAKGETIVSVAPGSPLRATLPDDRVFIRRQTLVAPARTPPGDYTLEALAFDADGGPVRTLGSGALGAVVSSIRVTNR